MAKGINLKRIRLELARTPEFPQGSTEHGYELVAPLKANGHVDLDGWRRAKELCHVTRFWGSQAEERGWLVHTQHGWCFDYGTDADEEDFFKLDRHHFAVGEYVSVAEHDRKQRTFRVSSVTPALPAM